MLKVLVNLLVMTTLLPVWGEGAIQAAENENVTSDAKADVTLFENVIRPLLIDKCVQCHGPQKSESGLRLDSLANILKGGDSGPAMEPGNSRDSLILKALRHEDGYEMPPGGQLDELQVKSFARWIERGAPWPDGKKLVEGAVELRSGPVTEEERQFWSFQPVKDPHVPPSQNLHLHPVDRFLIGPMQEKNLAMRPPASKEILLRRATFDLTGLPPSIEELEAFLQDDSADAYQKVIERLLSSRAYGERWGRHWLDVVRYADTAGETGDYPVPQAYKYRNWVIEAINQDLPYDEFIRQQIAGDLLAEQLVNEQSGTLDETTLEHYRQLLTATGFIAVSRRFGFDSQNYHHLTIQDTIDTLGQAVLGLTLGCARCHDHKFDPIEIRDYYAWYGIFKSTKYSFPGSEEKRRPFDFLPELPPALSAPMEKERKERLAALASQIDALKASTEPDDEGRRKAQVDQLSAERARLEHSLPYGLVYGVAEGAACQDSHVQLRGEPSRPGELVTRRNLSLLGSEQIADPSKSGRLDLANWLTDPKNPLTSRVMVNRIWQHHFGRGLVRTENDFGARGDRPTHPELLDWLASRFIESGWSLKAMHRLIMTSAAYQQASDVDVAAMEIDPDAKLLWRFPPRRLSAEEIRDGMLFVSGLLDRTPGGAHPFPEPQTWGFTQHQPFYAVYDHRQRSVYLMQQRLKRHPFLGLFDGADPNASTGYRLPTTVPTQALFLMNNELVHECSRSFAQLVLTGEHEESARLTFAYRLAYGRSPSDLEQNDSTTFLSTYKQLLASESGEKSHQQAWEALLRTLLIRNEFLYVQ